MPSRPGQPPPPSQPTHAPPQVPLRRGVRRHRRGRMAGLGGAVERVELFAGVAGAEQPGELRNAARGEYRARARVIVEFQREAVSFGAGCLARVTG